jgi:hypothetical protein
MQELEEVHSVPMDPVSKADVDGGIEDALDGWPKATSWRIEGFHNPMSRTQGKTVGPTLFFRFEHDGQVLFGEPVEWPYFPSSMVDNITGSEGRSRLRTAVAQFVRGQLGMISGANGWPEPPTVNFDWRGSHPGSTEIETLVRRALADFVGRYRIILTPTIARELGAPWKIEAFYPDGTPAHDAQRAVWNAIKGIVETE